MSRCLDVDMDSYQYDRVYVEYHAEAKNPSTYMSNYAFTSPSSQICTSIIPVCIQTHAEKKPVIFYESWKI